MVLLTSGGTCQRVLETSEEGHGNEGIEHLHEVLVGALDAVELVGVLVNPGSCVEIRVGNFEVTACLHDGAAEDNVGDDGTDSGAEDDPAVFIGNFECENHGCDDDVVIFKG